MYLIYYYFVLKNHYRLDFDIILGLLLLSERHMLRKLNLRLYILHQLGKALTR